MNRPPFEPTECSCEEDRSNCMKQPGHCLPGQVMEILEYLNEPPEAAAKYFWNSPGMVLGDSRSGAMFRIRTITPRFENGACVFFKDGLCSIHAVAPFGCRYFDMHMPGPEADKRAMWGVHQIFDAYSGRENSKYKTERRDLPIATHYRPSRFE